MVVSEENLITYNRIHTINVSYILSIMLMTLCAQSRTVLITLYLCAIMISTEKIKKKNTEAWRGKLTWVSPIQQGLIGTNGKLWSSKVLQNCPKCEQGGSSDLYILCPVIGCGLLQRIPLIHIMFNNKIYCDMVIEIRRVFPTVRSIDQKGRQYASGEIYTGLFIGLGSGYRNAFGFWIFTELHTSNL